MVSKSCLNMQRFVPSLIVLDTVAEMCSTVCCGQTKQSVMKPGNEIYRGAFFYLLRRMFVYKIRAFSSSSSSSSLFLFLFFSNGNVVSDIWVSDS